MHHANDRLVIIRPTVYPQAQHISTFLQRLGGELLYEKFLVDR